MSALTDLFPAHEADLIIHHNQHKGYYQTVQQAIDDDTHGYRDWVSEEQKQKAIDTDSCWIVQWYPNTPVGFNILSGADLEVVLEAARNLE